LIFLRARRRQRGGLPRPTNVLDLVQADHFEIRVAAAARGIAVRKLVAAP
jgi:hypothetical protein